MEFGAPVPEQTSPSLLREEGGEEVARGSLHCAVVASQPFPPHLLDWDWAQVAGTGGPGDTSTGGEGNIWRNDTQIITGDSCAEAGDLVKIS